MEIRITNDNINKKIISELEELIKLKKDFLKFEILESTEESLSKLSKQDAILSYYHTTKKKQKELNISYRVHENFFFICSNSKIKIEFYENKPCHLRSLFIDNIESLFNKFPVLKELEIKDINESSWWSAVWTPIKCTKPQLLINSFIVYYQLNSEEIEVQEDSNIEIPLIGILPIKNTKGFWFEKMINSKGSK